MRNVILFVAAITTGFVAPASYGGNLVATAKQAGQFNTLLAAAEAAGLVDALTGDAPLTVFAPTDEAFAALPEGTVEKLLKPENRDRLVTILKYHVISGKLPAGSLSKLQAAETLQGDRVDITQLKSNNPGLIPSKLFIDQAEVVQADVDASNGIIHVIDRVLMPTEYDIVDTAASAGKFQTLLAAAGVADLLHVLRQAGPLTVLAPTDEAFEKLPEGTVENLLKPENRRELSQILSYHVISGKIYKKDALVARSADTVAGKKVFFYNRSPLKNGDFVNNARLVETDIEASNGVIHVIDTVLLPSNDSTADPTKRIKARRDQSSSTSADARKVLKSALDRGSSSTYEGCIEICREACEEVLASFGTDLPPAVLNELYRAVYAARFAGSTEAQSEFYRGCINRVLAKLNDEMGKSK